MCPRTSTSCDSVCSAIFVAMFVASLSWRAVFSIFALIISLVSSCLEISFIIWVVVPSFPTHTVGLSALSARFIRRFIICVIIASFRLLVEYGSACRNLSMLLPCGVPFSVVFGYDSSRPVR